MMISKGENVAKYCKNNEFVEDLTSNYIEVKEELLNEAVFAIDESRNSTDNEIKMSLTQELQEISLYNEVLDVQPVMPSTSAQGIEANDIGNLLEQFLEYEQGSDVDPSSSYPDSSFLTPVASPGDPNDDIVLGRLMIVQEKLSQEVGNESLSSTPTDGDCTSNHNGGNLVELKEHTDKLLRTVNGVHPKGNAIRMADSPKFAKFKKKRLTNTPPLRRCNSATTTPRSTSPSDIVSTEELKRRKAKLIEALALTFPKQNIKKKKAGSSRIDIDKAKRNLSDSKSPVRKRKQPEPLASRQMPVVSKRSKKLAEAAENKVQVHDPRLTKSNETIDSVDPRLNNVNYGKNNNVTQLINTNLNSCDNIASKDTDDIRIVDMDHENLPKTIIDMTIDHDTLSTTIRTTQSSEKPAQLVDTTAAVIPSTVCKNANVKELSEKTVIDTSKTELSTRSNSVEQSKQIIDKPSLLETASQVIKPPKNYRQVNSLNEKTLTQASSESETDDDDDDDRGYKRRKLPTQGNSSYSRSPVKANSTTRIIPTAHSKSLSTLNSSKTISRSPSKTRSRSPIRNRTRSASRNRSRSPSFCSDLYGPQKVKRTAVGSENTIDNDNTDISCKLSELSNPVPYDIEHERKLRFLVAGTSKRNNERRNIYAGGIKRNMTRAELEKRFQRFGKIDKITMHFRDKGDNYAFVVFDEPDDAMRAIEEGNDDPNFPHLELCFGGRRKFVGGSYVDFDGNNSYLEESELAPRNTRCESPENDFDRLLKMAMQDRNKKKEATPEWT